MSLAKVIEVLAEGNSVEEALENAVTQAAKTVHSIKNVYLQETQGIVEDNKVVRYRVNAKVTFVLDE
ncbi:dodecin family protein [Aliifodinibius sp. S!AR15-10]|uniref:dodecin family protein n=1 Tax=Aliifodinibius sp. S!AR15-10 TaxID=2950437 RepID=UPI00286631FB|nr:dodecin family protein [Aliifodinibius sp. S!AR15-10]MDR8393243.1 dodecin family protein [Aliifodinibius sp. S!AR15-10]